MQSANEPLVTVGVTCYNCAGTDDVKAMFRKCLDSVVNQTYRNLEIILVDDGSRDETLAICNEYRRDPRVKVIHQENKGLVGAVTTCINAAHGEYMGFVDAYDDWCAPDMYEKMVAAAVEHEADVVQCNYFTVDAVMGKGAEKYTEHATDKVIVLCGQEDIRAYMPLFPKGKARAGVSIDDARWNKITKTILHKNNIKYQDERIGVGEDKIRTVATLLDAQRVVILPDYLYYYEIGNSYNWRKVTLCFDTLELLRNAVFEIAREKNAEKGIKKNAKSFWNNRSFTYIAHGLRFLGCISAEPWKEKKAKMRWLRSRAMGTRATGFRQFVLKWLLMFGQYRIILWLFRKMFPLKIQSGKTIGREWYGEQLKGGDSGKR